MGQKNKIFPVQHFSQLRQFAWLLEVNSLNNEHWKVLKKLEDKKTGRFGAPITDPTWYWHSDCKRFGARSE